MKGSGLLPVLSSLLLFFAACSSALPWLGFFDSKVDALIVPRQNQNQNQNNGDNASSTGSNSPSASASQSASSSGSSGSQSGTTITPSASASGSGSGASGSQNATTIRSTKTTAIDPRLPPGGVSLITPAAIDGPQYYKVGDFVTFAWNYTSLSVTPSAIDVLASCALNDATYTISSNMSVQETGAITWDTGEMFATATNPFPVASYTLIIHDSSQDITDIPSAGFLEAYEQYVFGMYTGQPYTPLNEFKCATCSGAFSIHEKQALGVILTTSAITILSFTWFARGFGVF
ncbi:uncharacterized protein Z520_07884 [Fonsecaea multimorphosa CBS 102226]|uniref:DUF7137 domain-containing protein n=1 Tax=Fonsecaea multimorphosa CBS 102226 TaxID=1442371 RepID=A0A0D2KJ25_9EURO|nr:uncharacterized protein Z520_07884 [Fonsecaea multimorphosa CBS 102226]KIX96618.1 hypothetical protein Z520_07884 [Fonsecaea multimorphosa CBS 102226]OAL22050.1 hypothetical protein AYO22_07490 [Fonsecaea multimorphosa]